MQIAGVEYLGTSIEPDLWPDDNYFERAMPGQAAQAPRFSVHWASEALEPLPERDYIWKPLLARRYLAALVGEGGKGKSTFLWWAGLTTAAGGQVLNFDTKQCNVVLIDEENGDDRTKRNLGAIMRGHYIPARVPFAYVSLASINLCRPKDLEATESLIRDTAAGLVLIDALRDVMPDVDENSSSEVVRVCHDLRGIAERTAAAIVMIHHANRAGTYRGSSVIKDQVDLMLMFDSVPDPADPKHAIIASIKREKTRDTGDVNFGARICWSPDTITVSSTDARPTAEALGKPQRYVLGYLEEHGDSDMTDIMSNADRCTPASARQAVYNLVDIGRVERKDDGKRGTPAVYGLRDVTTQEL